MATFLILFGAFFVWAGVKSWRDSRQHFKNAQKTEAEIVGVMDTTIWTDTGHVKAYQGVYAYKDADGNEYELRGRSKSTSKGTYPIGQRKTVYYNPDSPMEVEDTPAKVFGGLSVTLIAGVAVMALGVAAWVYDWEL